MLGATEMQATVRIVEAGRAIAREKMMHVGSPVGVGRVDAWEVGAFACSSTTGDDLRAACLPTGFEPFAAASDLLRGSTTADRRARLPTPAFDLLGSRRLESCSLEGLPLFYAVTL